MGIGKKAVTHKGKKVVEGATEDIPVVGDLVDDAVKSGPMDRADDSLGKTKDKLDRDKDKGIRDR
ncbi:MAG: hypothetical protein EP299_08380 [Acidobacteria bacterium]|nr:MAG: hypothetical protein EP299_08380 [Acidobacteriota bacterium]